MAAALGIPLPDQLHLVGAKCPSAEEPRREGLFLGALWQAAMMPYRCSKLLCGSWLSFLLCLWRIGVCTRYRRIMAIACPGQGIAGSDEARGQWTRWAMIPAGRTIGIWPS